MTAAGRIQQLAAAGRAAAAWFWQGQGQGAAAATAAAAAGPATAVASRVELLLEGLGAELTDVELRLLPGGGMSEELALRLGTLSLPPLVPSVRSSAGGRELQLEGLEVSIEVRLGMALAALYTSFLSLGPHGPSLFGTFHLAPCRASSLPSVCLHLNSCRQSQSAGLGGRSHLSMLDSCLQSAGSVIREMWLTILAS